MTIKPHQIRRERRLAVLARRQKPDGLDHYFEKIVQKFSTYMYSIAFSILRDPLSTEDAVSDALLKAYINLHGFTLEEREGLKVQVWLGEITRNVSIDLRKKQKEEESLELLMETGLQVMARPYDRPENVLLRRDVISIMEKCLDTLSPREKEIIKRVFMLEQPMSQIATDLGISRPTLSVALYRAILKLRNPRNSRLFLTSDMSVLQTGRELLLYW